MNVEISDQVFQAISAITPDVSSFVEKAARRELRLSGGVGGDAKLSERFRDFRGVMQGASIDEIASARHEGLHGCP